MSYLERLKKLNIPHIPTAITDTSTSVSCVSTYSEHIPENQFLATPATEGIQPIENVAVVANVAVAAKPNLLPDSQMTQREGKAIRSWLAFIEETDPELIDEVMDCCQQEMEARHYFLKRSEEVPEPDHVSVTCNGCQHFERIDHPHIGQCMKVEPESICGLWDTDIRYCASFNTNE